MEELKKKTVKMGKRKFNAKGRQVVSTLIDNSETKKVCVKLGANLRLPPNRSPFPFVD